MIRKLLLQLCMHLPVLPTWPTAGAPLPLAAARCLRIQALLMSEPLNALFPAELRHSPELVDVICHCYEQLNLRCNPS